MPNNEENRQKFNQYLSQVGEVGFVKKIHHPIAQVSGLPGAGVWEVVYCANGCMGMVMELRGDLIEVLLFTNDMVTVGTKVSRTGYPLEINVGEQLLGSVIDPLGFSLKDGVPLPGMNERRSIDIPPPGIDKREKVTEPLETGLSMVDFLIPLGKGQRELVIGDRNIGKTTFVLQSMLSQAKKGAVCVYAGIGKKKHSLKEVEIFMWGHGISRNSVIVGASSADPIGQIFIAPYTAMTIAEYFCSQGRDVLLILDDLTSHAKYYREMSLISKKFPGRDSYPGDVFYSHARLLERAGNFKLSGGGSASITCLPVCETVGGDISGYIQTNLMSITDGHIFFDQDLYKAGKRPAINYFLSVTRVGRQTQSKVRWGINRELSSFMVLHSKTERFIHFGAEINEGIKSTLEMGKNVNFFFDQALEEILSINVQVVLFTLIWTGILKQESEGKIKFYISRAQKLYDKDKNFKNSIDEMINACTDFNQLLGKVSARYKEILATLDQAAA